jgi:hypothetical protein
MNPTGRHYLVLSLGSTELYYHKKFEAVTLMMLNAIYCYVVTNNTILHPIRLEFSYLHSFIIIILFCLIEHKGNFFLNCFNLVYYLISTCIWE